MRVAMKFAYDGAPFHGYARQPHLRTVEGNIIAALIENEYIFDPKHACLQSASRTDKGVSSFGNVIAFNTDKNYESLLEDLSHDLLNIIPYAISKVDDSFYPRYAKRRIYRYYFASPPIRIDLLDSMLQLFQGTHDFSNFARVESHRNPVRTIERIEITQTKNLIMIDIYAQNFLWQQIRRIVGAALRGVEKKISRNDILNALLHPEKSRDLGVAPAETLVLLDVEYTSVVFETTNTLQMKKTAFINQIVNRFTSPFF